MAGYDPARYSPMLATLGSRAEFVAGDQADVDDWAFEMKWDGIRAIALVRSGVVSLFTRNGIDVTRTYPELAALGSQVAGDVVLDGEIVALSRAGIPDFGLLQTRMKLTRSAEVERARAAAPVTYLLFDILEAQLGDSRATAVTGREYEERRLLLEKLVTEGGPISVPPAFDGDVDEAIASSRELKLEGVMAKKRDSTYSVGKRSRAWVKLKNHKTQEVVIGGWRPGNGRRAGSVGSLLMGIPAEGGLEYVGRVGTGFGDAALRELEHRVSALARKTSPFIDVPRADASDAHWITPTLVGEVEYAEVTPGGRLRQPSWRGWRPDKPVDQVVREV